MSVFFSNYKAQTNKQTKNNLKHHNLKNVNPVDTFRLDTVAAISSEGLTVLICRAGVTWGRGVYDDPAYIFSEVSTLQTQPL